MPRRPGSKGAKKGGGGGNAASQAKSSSKKPKGGASSSAVPEKPQVSGHFFNITLFPLSCRVAVL